MATIHEFNQITKDAFIEQLEGIFEHARWLAEQAAAGRPYHSPDELFRKMVKMVEDSGEDRKRELIRAHPDLGGRMRMSAHSASEQRESGLQNLTKEEYTKFQRANEKYKKKFGFPFILAVRGKNKEEIYAAMRERLCHNSEQEFQTSLEQIYQIAYFRFTALFNQSNENGGNSDEFGSTE